ncbi:MAG: hypothetical protein FJX74_22315, partial [Armatimonadetes bacterium]|nr:hypothetical protein [Armatimonadota bacterium]
MRRAISIGLLWLPFCSAFSGSADEYSYTLLDDFEEVSPWVKGDPNTDLTQKEVAIAPSRERVCEGKQSLAFMIRVDWTPKPGEQYPKGWPMLTRDFPEPRDWSKYDAV